MNRNVNSRFAYNPTNIDIRRSKFKRNSSNKLTFNVGELVPFYVDEVLPGDTFNISTSKIVRLQTLLTPMMDNIYVDFYWFFVPNRLTWTHWKEFNGENTAGHWAPQVEYTLPVMCPQDAGLTADTYCGSVADYMGIPFVAAGGLQPVEVNDLPFRAYGLIYNEWFRNENLIDPDNVYLGDSDTAIDANLGRNYHGKPYLVSKYFDYFTAALPAPQKGPAVGVPLDFFDTAPVVTGLDHGIYSVGSDQMPVQDLRWLGLDGEVPDYLGAGRHILTADNSADQDVFNTTMRESAVSPDTYDYASVVPSNLWADTSNIFTGLTINELRMAFQVQKLLEKDARGGSRYVEILKSHFGVTSPDYRLQRPEYLGGNRVPLNINQVIQQSETSASSPMGNTAAMSVTSDIHSDFTKSFTEHGFILGLCVARYDHTYQQGIERFWNRKTRYDFYWPVLANIGEQAILNKELYVQGSSADDEVFGYQEAWADYRYKPSRVAGEMRSAVTTSLDVWHLADEYASQPYLSKNWIQESSSIVDRVLAVTSSVSDQLFMDVYVKNMTTRPMPLYSIPGLIDHH